MFLWLVKANQSEDPSSDFRRQIFIRFLRFLAFTLGKNLLKYFLRSQENLARSSLGSRAFDSRQVDKQPRHAPAEVSAVKQGFLGTVLSKCASGIEPGLLNRETLD